MSIVTQTASLAIAFALWGLVLFVWITRKLKLETDRHWLLCAFLSCVGPMFIAFGWEIGIPPEGNRLDTAVQCSLLLITALLTGPAVYVTAQKPNKYVFGATTAVHVTLCLAILLLPVIEAEMEARSNFDSVKKVPQIVAQSCDRGSVKPLFADLSDIHIVSDGSRTTNDGSVPGNDFIPADLEMVKDLSPRYLIITGDVTDTGSPDQWQRASKLFQAIPDSVEVVVTPGNHDQNSAFISREESLEESLRLSAVSALDPKIGNYFTIQEHLTPELKTPLGGICAAWFPKLHRLLIRPTMRASLSFPKTRLTAVCYSLLMMGA